MYIDKLVSYLFISFIQKSLLLSYYLFSFSYEEKYLSQIYEINPYNSKKTKKKTVNLQDLFINQL